MPDTPPPSPENYTGRYIKAPQDHYHKGPTPAAWGDLCVCACGQWLERRTGYWLEISSMQAWLTRRRYRRTERKQARNA